MKINNINNKILKYLKGEMSSEEIQSFQKEMEEDQFLKDSVNGYLKTGAYPDDIKNLKPGNNTYRKTKIIMISAISVAAGIAILLFFNYFKDNFENRFYYPDKVSMIYTEYTSPQIQKPQFDTIEETKYEDTNFYAENNHLKSDNEESKKEIENNIAPLYRKPPKKLAVRHKELFSLNWEASSNHLYGYLEDFKVVDYRIDNRRNRKNFTIPEAKFEKVDYKNSERKIKYYDFLASALEKYQEADYQSALNDFRIILNQYPDDLNAVFYAGMCHYKIGNYEKGIKVMDRVLNHSINTFDQDAEWYKALAYKEMEYNEKYRELLTSISKNNSYYGAKAGDLLKNLDNLEK